MVWISLLIGCAGGGGGLALGELAVPAAEHAHARPLADYRGSCGRILVVTPAEGRVIEGPSWELENGQPVEKWKAIQAALAAPEDCAEQRVLLAVDARLDGQQLQIWIDHLASVGIAEADLLVADASPAEERPTEEAEGPWPPGKPVPEIVAALDALAAAGRWATVPGPSDKRVPAWLHDGPTPTAVELGEQVSVLRIGTRIGARP